MKAAAAKNIEEEAKKAARATEKGRQVESQAEETSQEEQASQAAKDAQSPLAACLPKADARADKAENTRETCGRAAMQEALIKYWDLMPARRRKKRRPKFAEADNVVRQQGTMGLQEEVRLFELLAKLASAAGQERDAGVWSSGFLQTLRAVCVHTPQGDDDE